MHLSMGHKPTCGQGYQVGIGNRGPMLLATMGPYATITNLQIGNLPKLDLTVQLVGESYGYSTTVAFKFPRHSKVGR